MTGANEQLLEIMKKMHPEDVVSALFCFSAWTPNRSSEVKLLHVFAHFLTIKYEVPEKSSSKFGYREFDHFCKDIIQNATSFPMLEDYVPEGDWGNVKFFFDENQWKIPYGSCLDWGYDFLTSFKLIYTNYADQLESLSSENPITHLKLVLKFLDQLLNRVDNEHGEKEIRPGHLEIPPKSFWYSCQAFIENFQDDLSSNFMKSFSLNLGSIDEKELVLQTFSESCFDGTKYNFMFIKIRERYYPTIVRRMYPVLIEYWNQKSNLFLGKIEKIGAPIAIDIGAKVAFFAKDRISKDRIFAITSVGRFKEHADDFVFPLAILSRERIFLFAFTSPFSSKSIEQQLLDLANDFKRIRKVFQDEWSITLHLKQEQILLRNEKGNLPIPQLVVMIPNKSTVGGMFQYPEDLDAKVWFLEQFVGLLDECENHNELSDFLDYQENLTESVKFSFSSLLDFYSSFKDSHQTLIEGAIQPTFISLDPHWGSARRFRTLSEFWEQFPGPILDGDPRQWTIKQRLPGRISLASRNHFAFAHATTVGQTALVVTAPFDQLSRPECLVTDVPMQALIDIIMDHKDLLAKHPFFQHARKLTITFIPHHLKSRPDFSHINHIELHKSFWIIDSGKFEVRDWGARIVFNFQKIQEHQTGVKNRRLEVKLLQDLLVELDTHFPSSSLLAEIKDIAEKDVEKKARYTVIQKDKSAAFPEYIDPAKPEDKHFKKARNTVAFIARNKGIETGIFDLKSAKDILSILITEINNEILKEISKYRYLESIQFVISKTDALTNYHEVSKLNLSETEGREINFVPSQKTAKAQEKFQTMHRNYLYMLESFVLVRPEGLHGIQKEEFSYLVALIDWFFVFAGASDQIYFNISPVFLEITSDFLVNVTYDEATTKNFEHYSTEQAKKSLGEIGNKDDKIESPRDVTIYLDLVEQAFIDDLGFGIKHLMAMLYVLTFWPSYSTDTEEKEYYEASPQEIVAIGLKNIDGSTEEILYKVLFFLTLQRENLLKIIGSDDALLLPVWEYYKRHSRYAIRPLIETSSGLLWGAHSTQRATRIWTNAPMVGKLPVNLGSTKLNNILIDEKRLIENQLTVKASQVARRFSSMVDTNVQLHRRDKNYGHPTVLGDYDIVCYLKDKNILIIGECKHLLPVYSMKDARDLREDIFGRTDKPGYIDKIHRRTSYAQENCKSIFTALNWEYPENDPPKLKSLYISIHSYWWAQFPPIETDVAFLQIDMFDDFLKQLTP